MSNCAMKPYRYIIIYLLFSTFPAFTQDRLVDAPLSPDFLKYLVTQKSGMLKSAMYEGHYLNLIPSPVQFNVTSPVVTTKNISSLPVKYDLRQEGFLTSVKNQGGCGGCWNFVATGALESNWKKNGLGEFDLSEQNMRTCHKFYTTGEGNCTGGNHYMVAAYLSRRVGPVSETNDPYNPDPHTTCNSNLTPVAYSDEVRIMGKDKLKVKQAIMEHGGIYTTMYWTASCYNSTSHDYKYTGGDMINHAVLLVGWDDTRSIAGFYGAWIAKNSWGTQWGESGYFYISYLDAKALSENAYFPSRLDYNTSEKVYMYDELGSIMNTGYRSYFASALVKFRASGKEKITKLGTFINSSGGTVDFHIYYSMQGNDLINLLDTFPEVLCENPGYYVFNLPRPVKLNAGDEFYIKAQYYTPNYVYPIPVEMYVESYAEPVIEKGVCWTSLDGKEWTALGNNTEDEKKDLCLRAYTEPDTSTLNIQPEPSVNIYPNPCDRYININVENAASRKIRIEIFNLLGKRVLVKDYDDQHNPALGSLYSSFVERFDMQNRAKGIYLVKISGSGKDYSMKAVVQ